MIIAWLIHYWRPVVGGVCLLLLAGLAAGFHSRGLRVETLQAQLKADYASAVAVDRERQAERSACAQLADDLREQEAAIQALRTAADARARRLESALAESRGRSESRTQAERAAQARASEAIRRAETCEEQVQALAESVAEVMR